MTFCHPMLSKRHADHVLGYFVDERLQFWGKWRDESVQSPDTTEVKNQCKIRPWLSSAKGTELKVLGLNSRFPD